MSHIRKAVFPVAGRGTRFLPATKAVPKEMLPLVDKPLIQYAVEEAQAAGIEEFVFVVSEGKSAIKDHFGDAEDLIDDLRSKGKLELVRVTRDAGLPSRTTSFVDQPQALGLGHAIWCARYLVGEEAFAVLLPDDVISARIPCMRQLVDAHEQTGGSLVAIMDVPRSAISAYGCLAVSNHDGPILEATGIVEKPASDVAPSSYGVVGRYILQPSVFGFLEGGHVGAGGEIQLTDALASEIGKGGLSGVMFCGERFDCGSKIGFLEATVAFGLLHPDLSREFANSLRHRVFPEALVA